MNSHRRLTVTLTAKTQNQNFNKYNEPLNVVSISPARIHSKL